MQISKDHPLRKLFRDLVRFPFDRHAQVRHPAVSEYVSGILTDFTQVDNLRKIRNARGHRLEDVGEMLIESNPLLEARSFDREREVRKHIGDYALFFTGIFPESLRSRQRRRRLRPDAFADYIQVGKESYAIVSEFNLFEYREEAPLFRRLSNCFEQCVYGLNLVKQDLERMQEGYHRHLQTILGGESPA